MEYLSNYRGGNVEGAGKFHQPMVAGIVAFGEQSVAPPRKRASRENAESALARPGARNFAA